MPLLASNFTSNNLYGTTIVSGGWANVDLLVDAFAFEGDKTFVVKLRKDSTLGQVLGTSAPITIKDYTSIVSLNANISTVNEGDLVGLTLTTTNVVNYTNVAYSVFPVTANVNSADFVASTGYITIINNVGTFALQANADLSLMDETGETFRVQIRDRNNTNTYISSNITIADVSKGVNVFGFAESASATAEGDTLTLTFTATNADNRVLYYTTNGNATTSTFAGGNTGSFVMGPLSNTITLLPTGVPYGTTQNFTVQVRTDSITGPVVATSNNLIVIDSSIAYMSATGGTIVDSDGYRIHAFTSSGNLVVNSLGVQAYNELQYLAVAGGGGGGDGPFSAGGGGGGAGGLIDNSFISTSAGNILVVVGAGGNSGHPVSSTSGSNTTIIADYITITAVGGGRGGVSPGVQPSGLGVAGGSGGGHAASPSPGRAVAPGYGFPSPTQQGYPGGALAGQHSGGGGAGAAGTSNGGIGKNITWLPISYGQTGPEPGRYFAGGGGGGGTSGAGGAGGIGGGGRGAPVPSAGFAGNVNSGGGGGGGRTSPAPRFSGAGGSGIVLIRYPYLPPSTFSNVVTAASAFVEGSNITVTVNAINANNYTYYYTTEGNVISSDFIGGNTGSFVANASGAVFTLRANTNIPLNETRSFVLRIREDSITGVIRATSANITIVDTALAYVNASGGTTIDSGGYRIHAFTTSGNLTINSAGAAPLNLVEYLVVAGGAAGGRSGGATNAGGGGGGAGGALLGSINFSSTGNSVITIGAGGSLVAFNAWPLPPGGNTTVVFAGTPAIVAFGGGGGSHSWPDHGASFGNARPGGSGGGGNTQLGFPAGAGTPGQGYPGGASSPTNFGGGTGGQMAGGGGGAGEAGHYQPTDSVSPVSLTTQAGGNGIAVPWAPASYGTLGPAPGRYFAGGGGGGGSPNGSAYIMSGGAGGGGAGGMFSPGYPTSATSLGIANGGQDGGANATINTGGGGGGAGNGGNSTGVGRAGQGGSGIVLIRYPII
jgi:hypothetical protein